MICTANPERLPRGVVQDAEDSININRGVIEIQIIKNRNEISGALERLCKRKSR